uniref:Protein kinase domain-containing protein n=1 Tax=Timema bartmani TaxID=61472 RepID=A0A7R9FBQ3_9NEOP|nr:unnamed protein product [Timema bartmani]
MYQNLHGDNSGKPLRIKPCHSQSSLTRDPLDYVTTDTLTALVIQIVNITYEPIQGFTYELSLRELVSHMLRFNPEHRPTVEQLMSHSSIVPVLYPLYVNMGAILCDGRKRHTLHRVYCERDALDHATTEASSKQRFNQSVGKVVIKERLSTLSSLRAVTVS